MSRNNFLSDYIVSQFDIKKFETIIQAFLGLVELAQIMLNNPDYNYKITSNNEVRLSGFSTVRNISSKVESMVIHKYDNQPKLEELILKYPLAIKNLNEWERALFIDIYERNKSYSDIMNETSLIHYQFDYIRKSMIIRFCLSLGLEKYINEF